MFLPDDQTNGSQYNCPDRLLNFCSDRISQNTFSVPCLSYIVELLKYIYNLCIHKNVFPTAFKRTKVIPLPKTKTISTDLNNYRPISILSVLTKPLERHIHKHLTDFLQRHQLFHSFQSGFRSGQSCQTAVTRLTDTWLSALNNRQMSDAVFLDFRKAFDLVHYDIFTEKAIHVQLEHRKYIFLTILLTGLSTVRTCKWYIPPPPSPTKTKQTNKQKTVYNKWSA